MKSISDIFWNLPLNDSSTILFKWMKLIHNKEKKILKLTPQEKEIERVFSIAEKYNSSRNSGFWFYLKNPKEIGYISNNLNFLIERYDGQKKGEYLSGLNQLNLDRELYPLFMIASFISPSD